MFKFVCRLRFESECRLTVPGDSLFLTGDHPKLGSWDINHGIELSTDARTFPVWTTPEMLFVFVGMGLGFIQYKFVIKKRNGRTEWEPFAGNRCLEIVGGIDFITRDIWGQRLPVSSQNVRLSLSSLLKHPDARNILLLQKQIENATEDENKNRGNGTVMGEFVSRVIEEEGDRVIKADMGKKPVSAEIPEEGFSVTDLLNLLHSGPVLDSLPSDESVDGRQKQNYVTQEDQQRFNTKDPQLSIHIVPDEKPNHDMDMAISIPLQEKSAAISYHPHREFQRQTFILAHHCPIQDRYTLEDVIGRGTWGEVRVVIDKESGTHRAAKRIPKCYVEDCDRFRFEIELVKSLDHPNIVRVFETFEDANDVYLVMELCSGALFSSSVDSSLVDFLSVDS